MMNRYAKKQSYYGRIFLKRKQRKDQKNAKRA
jgi:hypothetical protein